MNEKQGKNLYLCNSLTAILLKNFYCILFYTICTIVFSQNSEENLDHISHHVSAKTTDFNAVFIPLLNTRDTLQYNELLQQSIQGDYKLGEIIAYNLLGTYYRDQSIYRKSIGHHMRALQLSEKSNIIDGILYSNNMLGVVYRRMDNVQRGLEYHFKALTLAEKNENKSDFNIRNTAIAVNGIGNSYLILNEYQSARKQFLRSMEIERSIKNTLGLAINNQNIGITYEETQELDSALIFYRESLKKNIEINNSLGKMICFNSISGVLMKQQKYAEALNLINQAESIALEKGDNFYTTTIYLKKAKILMESHRLDEALDYLEKSKEISIQHHLKTNLAETYESLSAFYEQTRDFSNALKYSRLSKQMEFEYLNENNLRIKNNLEISYDVESKSNEILDLEKEKALMSESVAQKQKTILTLALLMAALSLVAFLFFRQNKLVNENQKLELEQKVLRAQMNPHFTFNALNSIKSYIISEDKEKAVKYLNKFAKLIRSVLYSSDKRTITLQEELDALESYVDIEQLRLKDKVELVFQIDDVNAEEIVIPPLILQPFVENALWHGLATKKGNKRLLIHVYQNSKFVNIDIIDNGVGRDASSKLRDSTTHKSMGTQISQKRLESFFKMHSRDCNIQIMDLKEESGLALGTVVSICIPI
ncbi:MAG: tetratricopeptide repeat protein [Flavobacteriaceae bacterium]|nr:tetratricopeptide repeat protein [Flavobacteriaceae bacterium]